ncbi:MAG: cytochrome ubiquinol oxidase subunit I [Proteobacteria bacterium]|nr:cytochrome ubiquinol oxidase subunit I [Pseudomonadota bacterium]
MTDLFAARSQMAMSLGFHIIFAAVGMAMPLLMVLAEMRWLRTGDKVALDLAKRWSKGVAILVAIGAVSGTVLSFELGLLWPEFMAFAGPIIGMPFSLEGLAFFTEAIFLGIYLYGWDRVDPRSHLFAGIMVLLGGVASGAFVLCANGWMNTPTGFDLAPDGSVAAVRPLEALLNPAAFYEVPHMVIAAFEAVGFAVAGIHAWMLLKSPGERFHRRALAIALAVGGTAALLQPISGHFSAGFIAHEQPAKLAAAEGHWRTERYAAMKIGGWPNEDTMTTNGAIEIPGLLSLMAGHRLDHEVLGLEAFPAYDRPPVAPVHLAFDVMVGCGFVLVGVALLGAWIAWRRRVWPRWFLRLIVVCAPLGFIAIEAGWVVTEVGRQPWIIRGHMRTSEAVTMVTGLQWPLGLFTGVYLGLAGVCVVLLRRHVFASPGGGS